MRPPAAVYLMALSTRMRRACLVRPTSARTGTAPSHLAAKVWVWSIISVSLSTSAATSVRSNISIWMCMESLSPRARNSSCSTSSFMESASARMASMASCRVAGSSLPQRLSRLAYPWITAMGVRSSWLASETKRIWER